MQYELIAPCHFGLEAVMKRELLALDLPITRVEDGKVSFLADADGIAEANLFLRTTERILLKAGEFEARSFDELFEQTKALPWEQWIPKDGKFWVTKANSIKSKLFSPSDIQSIIKKAIVDRLSSVYHCKWFEESGAHYPLRVSIIKDRVTIGIDTSGVSLHKRGYRRQISKAPITETLAAALIMLTPWKAGRILVDPFCGSGTFLIEAAMMAANMAPGMHREFLAETWDNLIPAASFAKARERAADLCDLSVRSDLQGYDIDGAVVQAARDNAARAGLEGHIHFQKRPVSELSHSGQYGFLITNPPYGERLEEQAALPELYRTLGERFEKLPSWSLYLITGYKDAERDLGRKATKNRKIYNGMLKTYFYQYRGPKPGRISCQSTDGSV